MLDDLEKFLEQIEEVKKYCCEHGIDWDAIDCGYKPKVMEYAAFGLA
ncbi:hypothetical protein LCGC14_2237840 [marine sediment metagenome]|uniref:Uncharacterized protein n=1 Tax=marine sediment metagenome TaxID=412755 RepID=A0A0F9DTV8_9ZZZZ